MKTKNTLERLRLARSYREIHHTDPALARQIYKSYRLTLKKIENEILNKGNVSKPEWLK